MKKSALSLGAKTALVLGTPLTFLSALWLKLVLKSNQQGKVEEGIFSKVGILPIPEHYYQPLINPQKHLTKSLRDDRVLPGIDFNDEGQLALLNEFHYNDELLSFPIDKEKGSTEVSYFYNNKSYGSGDGEFLYNIIRHFKPRKMVEIGSGNSTLMAKNAIDKNSADDAGYKCEHICIEPYEMPWLESKNVKVIRKKVEDIELSFFEQLEANDILFIDSSHIIRPQGDVLCEYLQILPILKPGVVVHIHDIFMPKDYPDAWILKNHLLWNEQYLLEAFLSMNDKFKIIGSTNYLVHHHRDAYAAKCPVFAKQLGREPGAFWMQRV